MVRVALSATLDCRGADNATERDQQQAELTAALNGLNADIFRLIEWRIRPMSIRWPKL